MKERVGDGKLIIISITVSELITDLFKLTAYLRVEDV